MSKSVIGRLLVIGDNADEKAERYSGDKEVEPYIRYRFEDREKLRDNHIMMLDKMLSHPTIELSNRQREIFKDLYDEAIECDAEEFYEKITEGLDIDEETGDAYSSINPEAKYKYQTCYDKRLKSTGEESMFSNPFKLKDDTLAYIAKNGEIDWSKNHMCNTDVYKAAWEVCVEDREPVNDTEKTIKENMSKRLDYFANFKDSDEYVKHSCCFWTNSVITENGEYHDMNTDKVTDKKWVSEFYDRFVKPLDDDVTLTLYEFHTL